MQKNLKASANQLLVAYTPYVVVMLFLVSPLEILLKENRDLGFAAYSHWYENHFSAYSCGIILLSGCIGLLVSLSTFLMIGIELQIAERPFFFFPCSPFYLHFPLSYLFFF